MSQACANNSVSEDGLRTPTTEVKPDVSAVQTIDRDSARRVVDDAAAQVRQDLGLVMSANRSQLQELVRAAQSKLDKVRRIPGAAGQLLALERDVARLKETVAAREAELFQTEAQVGWSTLVNADPLAPRSLGMSGGHTHPAQTPLDPRPVAPQAQVEIRTDAGRRGSWNQALNKPQANAHYVVGGRFKFETDAQARVVAASVNLTEIVQSDRNKYQQWKAGGKDRLIGDEGGHIFGTSLGGPGERINLTAMDAAINQSIYKDIEAEWLRAALGGTAVTIEVRMEWGETGDRPHGYMVAYTIGKQSYELMLDNTSYPVKR